MRRAQQPDEAKEKLLRKEDKRSNAPIEEERKKRPSYIYYDPPERSDVLKGVVFLAIGLGFLGAALGIFFGFSLWVTTNPTSLGLVEMERWKERFYPLIFLGIVMVLPGAYITYLAAYHWLGYNNSVLYLKSAKNKKE